MKAKSFLIGQIVLIILAAGAGVMLAGDLSDGPRMAHKYFGALSLLSGLIAAIMITKDGANSAKAWSWVSVVLTIVGSFAGNTLDTGSYDTLFVTMRVAGVLALVSAIVALVQLNKPMKARM